MEEAKNPAEGPKKQYIYMRITHKGQPHATIKIQLDEDCPLMAENFKALCLNTFGFGYRKSVFHRVCKNEFIQGGDFECGMGLGGYSIFGARFRPEKNDKRLYAQSICMVLDDEGMASSDFIICLGRCDFLQERCVAFGMVLDGFDDLRFVDRLGVDPFGGVEDLRIDECSEQKLM